ncbi:hypothetical protein [Staphylococcus saprophyticus]|uniref:hypothetical protein n=1 Tax=Staphylococcus saprophyticus TaxID=29385 RepID=UPI001F508827|nr:hypothetical protein [Staphylococcus saprophyticus]
MEIKLDLDIENYDLTKGIEFNRETNADDRACERISELDDLLDGIFWDLGYVRNQTLHEPNNASGKRIRTQIDHLMNETKRRISDIEGEDNDN